MMKNFEERLTGGHPNSLGNTIEVVEEVLENNEHFDELFHCYFSEDEVVRLRTSNALKRVCKEKRELLVPYIPRFLDEIALIDQASTQWTLAQLFDELKGDMEAEQLEHALQIMKSNLAEHQDWIVLNTTMNVLGSWAKKDAELKEWILPHLIRLQNDGRKSVTSKAKKVYALLGS